MSEARHKEIAEAVDKLLGIKMTWEGPGQHDFRPGGARFVHSDLYRRVGPDGLGEIEVAGFGNLAEYFYDGPVEFKVRCGDEAATAEVCQKINAIGFKPFVKLPHSVQIEGHEHRTNIPHYFVTFSVPLTWDGTALQS